MLYCGFESPLIIKNSPGLVHKDNSLSFHQGRNGANLCTKDLLLHMGFWYLSALNTLETCEGSDKPKLPAYHIVLQEPSLLALGI